VECITRFKVSHRRQIMILATKHIMQFHIVVSN
jgi:hypothetical protein